MEIRKYVMICIESGNNSNGERATYLVNQGLSMGGIFFTYIN